jgi:hypothetical protein
MHLALVGHIWEAQHCESFSIFTDTIKDAASLLFNLNYLKYIYKLKQVANGTLKKGTAKTEAIIGTGISKLTQGVKAITEAATAINGLSEVAEGLSASIADKQNQIALLNVEYEEKLRQSKVDLELSTKANVKAFVDNYLATNGLTSIEKTAVDGYEKQITDLKAEQDAAIKKEVAIVSNSMKRSHDAELALTQAQFNTKEATNNATIVQLNEKVKFLEGQVNNWKTALDNERDAGVKRAQASAIGAVNVTGPGR